MEDITDYLITNYLIFGVLVKLLSSCGNLLTILVFSCVLGFVTARSIAPPSFQETTEEYKVKAVFLFHFAQFVDWPADDFTGEKGPLIIGILGDDPFGSYLDEVVAGEVINGHPLEVRRFRNPEDIDNCHILFIKEEGLGQLRASLKHLQDRTVLTVGENPAFIRAGGMIRFLSEDSKIRLQINPEAARASGLSISSKLLRLADISVPKI